MGLVGSMEASTQVSQVSIPPPQELIELGYGEDSVLAVLQQVLYTDWSSSNVTLSDGVQEGMLSTNGST